MLDQTLDGALSQFSLPDVITEGLALSASHVDLMEDDHPVNGDPMLSSPHVPSPGEPSHIDDDEIDNDPDNDSLVDMDMVA